MRKILALLSCGYALASLPPPAYFEVNRGQAGAGVQFVGRIAGNRLLLLTSQGSLVARLGAGQVKLHWLGAADTSLGEGLDPLAGRSHYFTGSQGANWLRGVSHYARVRYRDIYPGIDLIYYGAEGGSNTTSSLTRTLTLPELPCGWKALNASRWRTPAT